MENELTEEQLRALFAWIDAIPLSRPKRNIARDFSDGVLIAEVIHAYFPQLVELVGITLSLVIIFFVHIWLIQLTNLSIVIL